MQRKPYGFRRFGVSMPPEFVEDAPAFRPCHSWTQNWKAAQNSGWGKELREKPATWTLSRGDQPIARVSRVGDCWRVVAASSGWRPVDVETYRRPLGRAGGWRESMICPVCSRRCEVIFLVRPGPRCRRCGKLGYRVQYDRAERTCREVEKRYGHEGLIQLALGGSIPAAVGLVRRAGLLR
jgi:hypothetical protein